MVDAYREAAYFEGGSGPGYSSYLAQESTLRRTFRRLLRTMQRLGMTGAAAGAGGRLLEVGCAYGFFLDEAKPYFRHRAGTEFSEAGAALARPCADHVYVGGLEAIPDGAHGGQFDTIVLIHTIEHVYDPVKLLRGGQAEGTLTGGCLSILTSLSGTEWALPWTGRSVLLLEDVGEPPYKLHRMLVQLRDAGGLRDVQGIIFGAMEGCAPSSTDGFTLEDVLLDALGGFDGPVAIGAPLGHCSAPMLTLPLGARVLLSADDAGSTGAGRLHLLEPGVSDDVVVDLDA